jgi:hypothetical protein
VLVVVAVAIAFNVFGGLERDVPGYSAALQGSASIRNELNAITGAPHTSLAKCPSDSAGLVNCGPAPNFAKVTAWLNTPGGKPLSIRGLRGKVVLVDFWTYPGSTRCTGPGRRPAGPCFCGRRQGSRPTTSPSADP